MASSKFWYFSIDDHDDPNMIPQAMLILDEDATKTDHVNEIFYGFRRHGGGFGIEGYILFTMEKDLNFVEELLPIFALRTFNVSMKVFASVPFSLTALSTPSGDKHGKKTPSPLMLSGIIINWKQNRWPTMLNLLSNSLNFM